MVLRSGKANPGPLAIFVNKVLLELNHAHLFTRTTAEGAVVAEMLLPPRHSVSRPEQKAVGLVFQMVLFTADSLLLTLVLSPVTTPDPSASPNLNVSSVLHPTTQPPSI